MQHFGKAALRVTKNYTKGYSDTQAKVRDATSNDPWGPSGTQMNELAQLTYNQNDFVEIMEMLDKRLNDKGKNWRHVFKSLTVLDYCLHQGSENVVIYFKDNIYIVKTLKEFQYIDEDGKDQGANVRQKAKDITNLLTDEGRLREERRARASMRDRMIGGSRDIDEEPDENQYRRDARPRRAPTVNHEDEDLRRAIEESKKSIQQDRLTSEDKDLQEAIRLSKEEEERRNKTLGDANERNLFDDDPAPTSSNPFPATNDPNTYLQPQFTAVPQFVQPQYTEMPMQPQFTSFNPYQQQMQEYQQQQALLQQQQQQQQQEEWMRQQQLLQQQQQQEEWMRQQQLQQQQQQQQQQQLMQSQPTGFGTNNPFAPTPTGTHLAPPQPVNPPQFNLTGTYENGSNAPSYGSTPQTPSPQPQTQQNQNSSWKVKTKENENEQLAGLLANREDGQDTFGNIGLLRSVLFHSHWYGQGAGRGLVAQNEHNPFATQQQRQQATGIDQPFFSV
ncbi:ENTH-domain-containing protein [Fistulina hepatica ATCC 64428]|uniref:ENTH-domain-containing protein n=1 Tax=Fistulina hepatica ATCC 64428 TaxID=1128425 RepID=A0A0D6ZZB7_9AGAR|nr:ENTH-domain-containing protein [Fistulina hepatica ATCC 64428]